MVVSSPELGPGSECSSELDPALLPASISGWLCVMLVVWFGESHSGSDAVPEPVEWCMCERGDMYVVWILTKIFYASKSYTSPKMEIYYLDGSMAGEMAILTET